MYQEIIGDLKIILQQIIENVKTNNISFNLKYDWIDKIDSLKQMYKQENHSFVSSDVNGLVTEKVLNIIHNQKPWKMAYYCYNGCPISLSIIKEYFKLEEFK